MEYLRDPGEIYRRSFATIRAETNLSCIPADLTALAIRLVHACGMTDIVADLAWSENAGRIGREALRQGAPILVDAEMVGAGVIRARLPAANSVVCALNDPSAQDTALRLGTTRSAAAMDVLSHCLDGAVVAIGNAPTALFRLLEIIRTEKLRPALILGFPVGFVGAAESKEALIADNDGVPFVTLRGRRGGSALAAAAINALAAELPEDISNAAEQDK